MADYNKYITKIKKYNPEQLRQEKERLESKIESEYKKKPINRDYDNIVIWKAKREDVILRQVKVKNDMFIEKRDKKQIKRLK